MARVNYLQNAFTSGEISPRVAQQRNLNAYNNGLKELTRFITMPFGGVTRTPGTLFINEVKDSTQPVSLLAFQFSTSQTYIIETGPGYCRFYTQGALVTASGSAYEITNSYTASQIPDIQVTQSADILYLFHIASPPMMLSRLSPTNWTLTAIPFKDGPYMPINKTPTTLSSSGTTGSVTLTASAAIFAATDVGRLVRFQSATTWGNATITAFTDTTHVTATVNSAFDGTGPSVNWRLGSFSATTGWPATGGFYEDRFFFARTKAETQTLWGSAVGDYYNMANATSDDSAVTFTLNSDQVNSINWLKPYKILMPGTTGGEWSVSSSDFRNQSISATNIRAQLETTIGSSTARPVRTGNVILYVSESGKRLHEFVYSFENDGYVSPERSLFSEHITGDGISQGVYAQEPYGVYWCVRADGVLIGMTWLKEQEIIAWHQHPISGLNAKVNSINVVRSGTVDQLWLVVSRTINGTTKQYIEVMSDPFNGQGKANAHFVDSGLIYNGLQNSILSINPISGSANLSMTASANTFNAGHVGALIKEVKGHGRAKIVSVASPTNVIVQSILPFNVLTYQPKAWSIAVNQVSGLDHLEGETVTILSDGATQPDQLVVQGKVSLPHHGAIIHAGLNFVSRLKTLDPDAGSELGSSDGLLGRIHEISLALYETLGGRYAIGDNLAFQQLLYRTTSTPLNESPELFNGKQILVSPGGWTRSRSVTIEQHEPLPMTVLSILSKITVSDT